MNDSVRYVIWWLSSAEIERIKEALTEGRIRFTPKFAGLFATAVAETMSNAVDAGNRGKIVGDTPKVGVIPWPAEHTLLSEHCARSTGIVMSAGYQMNIHDLPGILTDLEFVRYRAGRN